MLDYFSRENLLPLLKDKGLLDEIRIKKIKEVYKVTKKPIEDIIVSLQFLTEEEILKAIAEHLDTEYVRIDPLNLDINIATRIIPGRFAIRYNLIVIDREDDILTIATSNPFDRRALEDIERMRKVNIKVVLTSKEDIRKIINEFYGLRSSLDAAKEQLETRELIERVDLGNLEQLSRIKDEDYGAAPVVKAVNHLLSYAFDQRASDIHIEPKRKESIVRFRIDGVLHPVHKLPKSIHKPIVSRIKIMAGLDISEKRRPQDGRIKTLHREKEIELRISIMPVVFGEKIVIRIFDPEILLSNLANIGFSKHNLERYRNIFNRPHGIVLVTGPTGSGKTTTLYATLRLLSTPDVNVVSIEEPVELVDETFNQMPIQPKIGITFASVLRTILRQDPDIIMVGEIRDKETAENAIQAALTGHLVLSTVHTNNAPSAITRLLDMDVADFLIASTLSGVIAQRLVRTICAFCKEEVEITDEQLNLLKATPKEIEIFRRNKIYEGKGCFVCRNTGYFGRSAIGETMPITDELRKLIKNGISTQEINKLAKKEGMKSLRTNGLLKVLEGITTIEEVAKAVRNT